MQGCAKRTLLVIVASMAMTSQVGLAARSAIKDVALREGGVLQGQLVDTSGAAKVAIPVVVAQNGKVVVVAKTDERGRFTIRGMRGGAYQIESANANGVYRLWAPKTAPPAAKSGVLLVADDSVVLGQSCKPPLRQAIGDAVLGGLLVGGAYWALDHRKSGS